MSTIRLIHIEAYGKFSLTTHLFDQAPPYAILSHTWGADEEEVVFEDMRDDSWKQRTAHIKLRFCADRAQKDGLDHFWIDTCCINKEDQRELQEAITSMYRWYAQSKKCYVLLSDVTSSKRHAEQLNETKNPDLSGARWFTRGWTLQELLAPRRVEFYSREGTYLGDKISLEQEIRAITHIDKKALDPEHMSAFSVRERMSWASNRKTKRPEDQSYCLAGIFGISLLPNYGEGEDYAFRRLKREIAEAFRTEVDEITEPWSTPLARSPGHSLAELSPEEKREKHRDSFMSALSFDQMGTRRSTIQLADNSTCEWFLTHQDYADWLELGSPQHDCRFLWLFGKPGAGKSTLMKFAHANAQNTKPEDEIIISFFFNARGDQLERSVTGMFRALLFQLVTEEQDLRAIFDDFDIQPLTSAILQKLFRIAMKKIDRHYVRCFIDALDECPEHQIQEMISFLEGIDVDATNANAKLYVCFASRHYPTIFIQYGKKIILENQWGHGEDIARYVRNHLRAGKAKAAKEIRTELQQKSNGVFLWVVLVTAILNDECRRGNIFRVKTRLRELPPELGALFKEILCRDEVDKQHLLLALQWILFAPQPLSIKEYYFAIVAGLDSDLTYIDQWDPEAVTLDDMTRFVHSSSKGLAGLTKSDQPTVQFIHESVRDYLIKEGGMRQLWPELGPHLRALSHDTLKLSCINYIRSFERQSLANRSVLVFPNIEDDMRQEFPEFPFLGYATQFVWHHAEEALSTITPQDNFLKSFDPKTWLRIYRMRHGDPGYTETASLLYILADCNCPGLINALPRTMPTSGDREQRHRYPIFAAFERGHRDAVRALLFQVETLSSSDGAETIMADHIQDVMCIDESNVYGQTALECAALREWKDIFQLLLDKGANIDAKDNSGRTILHRNFQSEICEGRELLIDGGASLEVTDQRGMTVLHHAVDCSWVSATKLLINRGARPDTCGPNGFTALHMAIDKRDEFCMEIVPLLIKCGVDLEVTNNRGMTALHHTVQVGKRRLTQLLIEKGAQIEAVDHDGCTALHVAAYMGYTDIARYLIDSDANMEARDGTGMTALHRAVRNGRGWMAKFLIEAGARINATDKDGYTALDWASRMPDVVELLRAGGAVARDC